MCLGVDVISVDFCHACGIIPVQEGTMTLKPLTDIVKILLNWHHSGSGMY